MNEKLLINFASRSRPEKFFTALQNITSTISDTDNYMIVCSLDTDDKSCNTEQFKEKLSEFQCLHNIVVNYGISKNKIDAINRANFPNDWDILINTSDDMKFVVSGWDDIIRKDFRGNFDLFLHYNDSHQKSNISTMSIMGRAYYNRFKFIYHPDYKSVWCDVEATETAIILDCYRYMGDQKVIFKHQHPAWGETAYDEQYRKSENLDVWGQDLQTLIERKLRNYDLPMDDMVVLHKFTHSDVNQWIRDLNNARFNNNLQPMLFKR